MSIEGMERFIEYAPKKESALDKQVGGNHYKKFKIQPIEFCHANKLDNCQSEVISYLLRHRDKNGKDDLLKAIHTLQIYIELEYPNS